jgi:hypothetical protein
MNTPHHARKAPPAALWLVAILLAGFNLAAQDQYPADEGVQVLTRGPVHEAFAQAGITEIAAGVIISTAPPDPITELPPDQRPEGANVAWIPGYWSWDDDRSDFIWVSGVWRDMPPGRQWVPGYWAPVDQGWQWVAGFWADAAQSDVNYLPDPPESLEAGPSSPAPASDHIWTPGCWIWRDTRYNWQPGYWLVQQPDWIWAPPRYTRTPRGCVYVPGYWDYGFQRRGVLFAPIYYEQPIYVRPRYYYSPAIVIDLGVITTTLFVQTRSHHYYFGDYYDRRYEGRGYYPWSSNQLTRYGYDPIYFSFRSQQLRRDPNWDSYIDEQYRYRRQHVEARPPQTLALQINIINTRSGDTSRDLILGKSLDEVTRSETLPVRFTSVSKDERERFQTRGQEMHKFQTERRNLEAESASGKPEERGETSQPVRMRLPASPVAAGKVEGANAPPPAPAAPEPEGGPPPEKPPKGDVKEETPSREKAKPTEAEPREQAPEPQRRELPREPETKPSPEKPPKGDVKEETPSREKAKPTEAEPREQAPEPQRRELPREPETKPSPEKPRGGEVKEEAPPREKAKPTEAEPRQQAPEPQRRELPRKPETKPSPEKPRGGEVKEEAPPREKARPTEAEPRRQAPEPKRRELPREPSQAQPQPEPRSAPAEPRKQRVEPQREPKPRDIPAEPRKAQPGRHTPKPEGRPRTVEPGPPAPRIEAPKREVKPEQPRPESRSRGGPRDAGKSDRKPKP